MTEKLRQPCRQQDIGEARQIPTHEGRLYSIVGGERGGGGAVGDMVRRAVDAIARF